MGSVMSPGHPYLGGRPTEQKSPYGFFSFVLLPRWVSSILRERKNVKRHKAAPLKPESGLRGAGMQAARKGFHRAAPDRRMKSGSPGGLPGGAGALTPALSTLTAERG